MSIDWNWGQIVSSVACPLSILSSFSTCVTWHFFEQAKKHDLSFFTQIKVAPFFMPIIITKLWVLSRFSAQVNAMGYPYLITVAPSLLFLIYQFGLFTASFCVRDSAFAHALSNMTSLRRPSHDPSQVGKVIGFYRLETVTSSLICLSWAIFSKVLSHSNPDEMVLSSHYPNFSWIGITLTCASFLLTQLYLRTESGIKLLFPEGINENDNDQTTKGNSQQTSQKATESQKSPWVKRPLALTSILLTVAVFIATPFSCLKKGL